jgi:hypothetical protein
MFWSNRFNPIGDGHVITSHADDMASEHFRTNTSGTAPPALDMGGLHSAGFEIIRPS